MTLTPVLIIILSNRDSEKAIRIYSYIGYLWLAFLVIFFPTAFIIDAYNYALQYGATLFGKDLHNLMLSPGKSFIIPFILSLAINTYGYFEAHIIRIERLLIKTSKLPQGTKRIRIAQISDLHLGIIVRDKKLKTVIKKINKETPDIVVSTGDLVDGTVKHINHLTEVFRDMNARMGKFAVIGNHEMYGGIRRSTKFTEESGFQVLRGAGITIDNKINIVGMDFRGGEAKKHMKNLKQLPEHEVLSSMPRNLFTLLLKHKSDVEDKSLGLFDLQLSGHTHGGQIFPMTIAVMLIFSYHTGFTKLTKGSAIYTSRGTGTSGPPIRFLSSPEITVIDIEPED